MKLWFGLAVSLVLVGCAQPHDTHEKETEIKPAVPPSADASHIAKETYGFIENTETLLQQPAIQTVNFEQQIFAPVRTLLTRWQLEVKQSDSIVGDQYTICRGALVSLDAWARSLQQNSSASMDKQQVYDNQKQLCAKALQTTQHGLN